MNTYSAYSDVNIVDKREVPMSLSFPIIPPEVGFSEAYELIKDGIPFSRISGLYPRMALGLENGIFNLLLSHYLITRYYYL